MKSFLTLIATILFVTGSAAACLEQTKIDQLVAGFPQSPLAALVTDMTLDDAYCSQQKFVKGLQSKLGNPVGYKVGFTGQVLQQRFNIDTPAYAVLLDSMFIESGSELAIDFGYRPAIEPDFMVVVKSAEIMSSQSPRDTLKYLTSVHPYLELPAIQFNPDVALSGVQLVAVNIAATYMVMGEGMQLNDDDASFEMLANIRTRFVDDQGNVIQEAPSSNLMGHPLNVVFWLLQTLKEHGKFLKAGDRLSLGAPGRLFPLTEGGKTYYYHFEGMETNMPAISVRIK